MCNGYNFDIVRLSVWSNCIITAESFYISKYTGFESPFECCTTTFKQRWECQAFISTSIVALITIGNMTHCIVKPMGFVNLHLIIHRRICLARGAAYVFTWHSTAAQATRPRQGHSGMVTPESRLTWLTWHQYRRGRGSWRATKPQSSVARLWLVFVLAGV